MMINEAKYFCQGWKSVILAPNDVTTMGIAQNLRLTWLSHLVLKLDAIRNCVSNPEDECAVHPKNQMAGMLWLKMPCQCLNNTIYYMRREHECYRSQSWKMCTALLGWGGGGGDRAYKCQSAAFFRVVGIVTATPCRVRETIHMCSVRLTRNFSSSLFIPHGRLFRRLTTAWTSSPPCSPCSPRPKPCWRMNGTQWCSSKCCFGVMHTLWNSVQ